METTKLYNDIADIIREYPTLHTASQSIEHLVYDKLEGFGKWILIEGFEPRSDNGVKWFGKGETEYYLNELIQLYLNKEL